MDQRITVVGAGVIGLTSAIRLAEAGYTVDVLARELPLETTSAVAGGLWLPFLAEPVEVVGRWARLTYDALLDQAQSCRISRTTATTGSTAPSARTTTTATTEGTATTGGTAPTGGTAMTGVVFREGFLLGSDKGAAEPAWTLGLGERLGLTRVTDPAPGYREGWRLRVPLVDMSVYLPYLVRRLHAAGGTLTRLPLTALPTRGLVVNCTGLAARALAADPAVHPIRGHVVWLTNPGLTEWWADQSLNGDDLTYVLPHAQHVVVGGTAQFDDWSTTPENETTERILKRVTHLVPELRKASVLSVRVGLRPGRSAVRLETVRGTEASTVHCYGHGGSGVTLSWGCADDVLTAVNEVLAGQS